jgi:hypothetical protein
MSAHVLRLEKAPVDCSPARIAPVRRAAASRNQLRPAVLRWQRNWWPDATSATPSWMAYRLAPRV